MCGPETPKGLDTPGEGHGDRAKSEDPLEADGPMKMGPQCTTLSVLGENTMRVTSSSPPPTFPPRGLRGTLPVLNFSIECKRKQNIFPRLGVSKLAVPPVCSLNSFNLGGPEASSKEINLQFKLKVALEINENKCKSSRGKSP